MSIIDMRAVLVNLAMVKNVFVASDKADLKVVRTATDPAKPDSHHALGSPTCWTG